MSTATSSKNNGCVLYLQQIEIKTATRTKFRVHLLIDHYNVDIVREGKALTWAPSRRLELPPTCQVTVAIKGNHTVAGVSVRTMEAQADIGSQEIAQAFWNGKDRLILISKDVTFDGQRAVISLRFNPSPASERARSALHGLQVAMKDYRNLMTTSTYQHNEMIVKDAVALSEMNAFANAAIGVASGTLELLGEQQKDDFMVSSLADSVEKIVPLVQRIQDETLYFNTELSKGVIRRTYDIIFDTAKFICRYVHRGPLRRTANFMASQEDIKRITELGEDLSNLVTEFEKAVGAEALRRVKKTKELLFLQARLNPVEAGYNRDRCCMPGTREDILSSVTNWALQTFDEESSPKTTHSANIFWLYGISGIGKTAVANSICDRLHKKRRLGGSFFCRQDDPHLSDPKYVLPKFIFDLAERWGPYRKLVIEKLREDPKLNSDSAIHTLFSQLLKQLLEPPPEPLVLVIDALNECGEPRTRDSILKILYEAASQHYWLKIIVTSRQDQHIETFFQNLDSPSPHLSRDLAADELIQEDITLFAQSRLASIAADYDLPEDWPGKSILDKLVARARGLFIYVETVWRLVKDEPDPERTLLEVIEETSGDALRDLYKLYATAIESRIGKNKESFRRAIGIIVTVAPYRPLCDGTIATLAGLETRSVQAWMDDLNSLLYRDTRERGAIRVRHLSIIDFLKDPACPEEFRVNAAEANLEVSLACLNTMVEELAFNICELETSFLSNDAVKDLARRVDKNMSDALQYSCTNWASHMCSVPYSEISKVYGALEEFFKDARPLYWMEALSVMRKVPAGIHALRQMLSWAKMSRSHYTLHIEEGLRFLLTFQTPITTSAPHIYISALPFIPRESNLWTISSELFQKIIMVWQGRMDTWPARLETWVGHTNAVKCITYSPDGLHVASCSGDNTIRVWDAETGRSIGGPLKAHSDSVNSIAYSPDGRYIVSGSSDKTIRIWDAETGRPVGDALQGHTNSVNSVAYSPDGQQIVSGSWDKTVRIWDAETGRQLGEPLEGHLYAVYSVAYSSDGRYIASGSRDTTIRIWDARNGRAVGEPLQGHTYSVYSVAYSPDGRYLVSGSDDETVRIWDTKTRKPVGEALIGHTTSVYSVAYSPDGRHIVSGSSDKTIRIWDADTGWPVGEPLKGHTDSVYGVAYSPDGRHIVSGCYDTTIRIWDAETGDAIGEPWTGHTNLVSGVAYSPHGRHIVSGSWDKTIQIWDMETGRALGEPWEGHSDLVTCVEYSPDSMHVISGSWDNTIRIWDMEMGELVGEPLEGHTDSITSVAYSPDGRRIISGSDDETVRIWDADTGRPVGEPLYGHTAVVYSVAYSPDGRYIASGSDDKTIRVWNAETGRVVGEPFKGHTASVYSVSYSPDGLHIVSGSKDKTIRIWDAQTGKTIGEPLRGHSDLVSSVRYSPDGSRIVSGSGDAKIRIWDAETGRAVGEPLRGHVDLVNSVAYSLDGWFIVSGSADKTIRIWDAETGRTIPETEPVKRYPASVYSGISSQDGRRVLPGFYEESFRFSNVKSARQATIPSYQSSSRRASTPSLTIDLLPDSNGWVHHPDGGLLFWVPEDCRNGLTSPSILTIPTTGPHRAVRLDFTDFRYGSCWEEVKEDTD